MLVKEYVEARDDNGYFDHTIFFEEKCKTDAAYCESRAGQNMHANDLRHYSSTQLPETFRLDNAIHILEHYGECCELHRKLTFPAEQVLSKHCECNTA